VSIPTGPSHLRHLASEPMTVRGTPDRPRRAWGSTRLVPTELAFIEPHARVYALPRVGNSGDRI
jgi:hypothetical protein